MIKKQSIDEHQLIILAQAGNRSAFDSLMGQHLGWIKHFLFRYSSSPHDRDDIVQDVLIIVWRSIQGFRGDAAFRTWLYSIVDNTAKKHYRSGVSRFYRNCISISTAGYDSDDIAGIDIGHADTPDKMLEAKERLSEIQRECDLLPPEMAETFELRNSGGLSYDEIAKLQGIPVGTVRSRINRARLALGLLPGS